MKRKIYFWIIDWLVVICEKILNRNVKFYSSDYVKLSFRKAAGRSAKEIYECGDFGYLNWLIFNISNDKLSISNGLKYEIIISYNIKVIINALECIKDTPYITKYLIDCFEEEIDPLDDISQYH